MYRSTRGVRLNFFWTLRVRDGRRHRAYVASLVCAGDVPFMRVDLRPLAATKLRRAACRSSPVLGRFGLGLRFVRLRQRIVRLRQARSKEASLADECLADRPLSASQHSLSQKTLPTIAAT